MPARRKIRVGFTALLVCCALVTLSVPPARAESPAPPPNLLVVVMDSLRADHLGAYGYARPTSPAVDTLAADGFLFERAAANSSYTGESVSVMFSGMLPSRNAFGTGWYARPSPAHPALAELLAAAGYATGLFTDSPVMTENFHGGFDVVSALDGEWTMHGAEAKVTDDLLAFIGQDRERPFFAYVHYLNPHTPYTPKPEHTGFVAGALVEKPLDVLADVRPNAAKLAAEGFGPGDPRFEDMVARYDAEIAQVDAQVRRITDALAGAGMDKNTVVVFTADHGEEFMEHGFVEHSWRLYPESVHVPMIWRAPGRIAPGRSDTPVSLADLYPTLACFAGVAGPLPHLDGEPLFEPSGGLFAPRSGAERPVISELMIQTRPMLRGIRLGALQYIAAWQWCEPADCSADAARQKEWRVRAVKEPATRTDPWGPVVREQLFDLSADPGAKNNLAGDPARASDMDRMRALLNGYRAKCPPEKSDLEKMGAVRYPDVSPGGADEKAPEAVMRDMDRQLRELGYK